VYYARRLTIPDHLFGCLFAERWRKQMSKSLILMLCLLTGLLLFACAKPESTTNSTNSNTATTPAAASPAATVVASGDKIGVTECDAFLEAYEACVRSKVPEVARAQFNTTLAQWRKSWRDLAANPQTRGTLAQACKTQLEAARQSMKPYNCTF
jgi:hypothetical protein